MTTSARVEAKLIGYRRRLSEALATASSTSARLSEARKEAEGWSEARKALQEAGQAVQATIHKQIAGVVTKCLRAVFDEDYEFGIEFEKKRGRTEARLFFLKDGNEVDPVSADSGGVVDVAAFALRVACLRLHQPALRKTLVFDEPFRFLSARNRPKVAALVEKLSKETGIQFIIVTQDEAFEVGKVIEIE